MRRTTIALGAAALLVSAGFSAQAIPNFAGTWTLVSSPDAAPAGGGGGGRGRGGGPFCGMECTIQQDTRTLTVSRTTQTGDFKATYNLDGSPSKNTMSVGQNTMESTSTAKVDAGKLVITTKQQGPTGERTSTTTLSLDGRNLKVEQRNAPGPDGASNLTTQTYTRRCPPDCK